MPTYQYRCTDCGRDLEVVQKFSDASLTECPTCAGQLRKVFNAVGVVFKGSGFYRNDSRAAERSSADSTKADAGDGSSEKSGDKDNKGAGTPVAAGDGSATSGDKTDSKPAKTESSKTEKPATGGSGASSTGSKAAAR